MLAGFTQSRSFTCAMALNTAFLVDLARIGIRPGCRARQGPALSRPIKRQHFGLVVPARQGWLK